MHEKEPSFDKPLLHNDHGIMPCLEGSTRN